MGNNGAGHQYSTTCKLKCLELGANRAHIGEGFKFGQDKLLSCVIISSQLRQAFAELDLADAKRIDLERHDEELKQAST